MLATIAISSVLALAPGADDGDADVILGDAHSFGQSRLFERRFIEPSVTPGAGFRRDLTFRPWSPFFLLKEGHRGTWSLIGTTFGGCLDHLSGMPCQERAEAGVALSWRPKGSIVSFFAGVQAVSMPTPGAASGGVGFIGGIVVTPASLAALVRSRVR